MRRELLTQLYIEGLKAYAKPKLWKKVNISGHTNKSNANLKTEKWMEEKKKGKKQKIINFSS